MKIKIILLALALILGLFFFFTRAHTIGSTNMSPTLLKGDKYTVPIISVFSYEPKRWDIVLYKTPSLEPSYYIGRVVALPNEKVSLNDGQVFINDKRIVIPKYLQKTGIKYYSASQFKKESSKTNQSHTMNSKQYFILGDNSKRSHDSRFFGGVEREGIINKIKKVGK
ncbi:signal peptidase I [Methylophaga thiooxydans]|uniref:signal peptidase I n=1 Tax=Methylophaga thiooxydans TaxID=392484 RepID=UPI0005C61AAD|nr:signal peptidase I [Methylophaga thiooxydans]